MNIEFQSVLPFVGIGSHRPPSSGKLLRLPPWTQRGGGYSLAGEGVHGRTQSDDWKESLALYTVYFVVYSIADKSFNSCIVYNINVRFQKRPLEDPFRKMAVKGIFR